MVRITIEDPKKGTLFQKLETEMVAGYTKDGEHLKIFLVGTANPVETLEGMADTMCQLGRHIFETGDDDIKLEALWRLEKKLLKRAFRKEVEIDE